MADIIDFQRYLDLGGPLAGTRYVTLAEEQEIKARKYLKRADDYRAKFNEAYARGCERKALKALELGFEFKPFSRVLGI